MSLANKFYFRYIKCSLLIVKKCFCHLFNCKIVTLHQNKSNFFTKIYNVYSLFTVTQGVNSRKKYFRLFWTLVLIFINKDYQNPMK